MLFHAKDVADIDSLTLPLRQDTAPPFAIPFIHKKKPSPLLLVKTFFISINGSS